MDNQKKGIRSGTLEMVSTPQWEWETAFYISMTSSDKDDVFRCLSLMKDLEENFTKKELDLYRQRVFSILDDRKING
jgi:hypothetical protein